MVMRHLLGALLALTLLLAGCGGDDTSGDDTSGDRANDPASGSAPTESSPPADGSVDFTEIAMVSESAVGGQVSAEATVLDSDAAVDEFAAQFDDTRMGERLKAEIAKADVPDGQTVVGAVVSMACDAPEQVFVEQTGRGLAITGSKVPTDKQCLVPVTTVALVAVDSAVA
jgi:hypothetical protein